MSPTLTIISPFFGRASSLVTFQKDVISSDAIYASPISTSITSKALPLLESSLSYVAGFEKFLTEDGFAVTVFDKQNPLKAGDKIVLNGETFEIACTFVTSPVGGEGNPTIIVSEDAYYRLTGERDYSVLDIQLTNSATDETVNSIRALFGNKPTVRVRDLRDSNAQAVATYWAFRILVYGFLLVIALISLFNIINSVSMSAAARKKEYIIMRAVGMSARQMKKMLLAQSAVYALSGAVLGTVLGLFANKFIYEAFITAYFGDAWQIPVIPLAVTIIFFITASLAASGSAARQNR